MTVVVTHTTPADSSFSTAGASAWNANHTLSGVGTMAGQDSNAVAITGGSVDATTVGATTASTGAFTTLSASSTVSGTGFSAYLASPPAIGGTTAAAGTFTTLTGTGQTNLGGSSSAPSFRATVGDNAPNTMWIEAKGASAADAAVYLGVGGTPAKPLIIANNTNAISFRTTTIGGFANQQLNIAHTASAVNYVQVTGAATGSNPVISTQGSDGSRGLAFWTKGSTNFNFFSNGGSNTTFVMNGNAGTAVNYLQVANSATTVAPNLSAQGTDTDISVAVVPKGLGIVLMNQQTPTAVTATGTLTIANLLTQIVTSTSATAVSLTLPTGTLSDAGVSGGTSAVNTSFDWAIINLGSAIGDVTLVAGTAHTIVGSVTVTVGTTGRFRSRKTATNTFVTYRV